MKSNSDASTRVGPGRGRPIKNGDLVRTLSFRSGMVAAYRYGTVFDTKFPMRDDPDWIDCKVFWLDNGEETHEWCGELELINPDQAELTCL